MEWHDRKAESPRAPIDKNGYLCRCLCDANGFPFYTVLQYVPTGRNPHFQHELSGIIVTHWATFEALESKAKEAI